MTNKEQKEIVKLIKAELEQQVVKVERCRDVSLPTYANFDDAGMDVRSAIDYTLEAHTTTIIPTGLKVALPPHYELQVRPRSGLSVKTGLRIANAPGTIDGGYRDEVGLIITNTSDEAYDIKKGDRLAQLVLAHYCQVIFEEVQDIKKVGHNRGGGFGHTGLK